MEFEEGCEEITKIAIDTFDHFIVLGNNKPNKGVITMVGDEQNLNTMLHNGVAALRERMRQKGIPEPIIGLMLGYITYDNEEHDGTMLKNAVDKTDMIPDWLRKKMGLEDKDEKGTVSDRHDEPVSEKDELKKAILGLADALRDLADDRDDDPVCNHECGCKDRG